MHEGLVGVERDGSLATIAGTHNQLSLTTVRIRTEPTAVAAPGVSVAVTAASVPDDVLPPAGAR